MWWDGLTNFQQIVFIFAVTASVLLLIFLIMMLIGMGSHADFDDVDASDFDADGNVDIANDEPLSMASGLKLVTLRGVLAFFSIGGWIAFIIAEIAPWWLALIIGIICGSLMALILAIVFKQIQKLEQNGNLDYRYAIGKQASVYIKIPADNSGIGKIIVQFNDKYLEVEAVTSNKEDIGAGSFVKIVGLKENNILIVE